MVRVNIIEPFRLADQHLIAEYDEILMLLGYVRRFPSKGDIPPSYRLGKGHIRFFKDKLFYLKKRHESLKEEMRKRMFKPRHTINLDIYPQELCSDWAPQNADREIINQRLKEKLLKKPGWYRYYGKSRGASFFINLLSK